MSQKQADNKNIALFGGTFDPPHIGHTAFCEALVRENRFDRVWVLPAFHHPFSKRMAPFENRLEMCKISFSQLGSKVKIRDDEAKAGGEGYTIDLLKYILKNNPRCRFTLVLGADNYEQRHQWKDFESIESMVDVLFFGRKGWERQNVALGIPTPFPEVSSSEIRRLIRNQEIPDALLPPGIAEYIRDHGLYREE